ncbi:TonB-dependent receptor [Flavobacterium sp. MFBS3-15]|uniref:TonB-dependent receptor n=1 Tax=Flavobacterium sp. MFBS3-15 TaxID=2989816 RepID=UPI00223588F8|nr:TonB-dependent receptor [Flavobacterium sp. MFBS3-15]MCW4468113.1 TonB-dependent receptor [Flavobacterium sp. MFBS3-15]
MIKPGNIVSSFILLLACQLNGQTLEGTVSSDDGAVPYANILVRKKSAPDIIIKYTITDEQGSYSMLLNVPSDSLILEANTINFESQAKNIKAPLKGSKLKIDFFLKPQITTLKEVVIEKQKPVTQDNDTITYNPDFFKDGSEKVVEDLLRKLPGIRILENGEIKYKGKSIRKFLLDGDDLFDKLYTVGSKNIDVNIIEAVQAIENFNENPLLKGLVNSEDVALNLKLKKGESDLSGSAKLGYGYRDRYKSSVTGLLVNQKIKGFVVGAYNNAGVNNSPYDFQSSILSVESLTDGELEAKELIGQGNFYSQVDEKYRNINSSFYSSANLLYKITPAITAKANFGIYDDRFTRRNELNTQYKIDEQEFSLRQTEDLTKKPRLYTGALYMANKPKDSLAWEYKGKLNYRETDFMSLTNNNGIYQLNNINSINFFTRQDFNLTRRLSAKGALSASAVYTSGRVPQSFILTPGVNFEEGFDGSIVQNNEDSRYDKDFFSTTVDYFHSISKELKLKVNVGYSQANTSLKSALASQREDVTTFTSPEYQNDNQYNYRVFNAFPNISYFKKNSFGINIGVNTQYFNLSLSDRIRTENNIKTAEWVVSPRLKLNYILNPKSSIFTSYNYSQIAPSEDNLFSGVILTGYRSFRNNEPDLKFFKTHQYSLGYNYQDFYSLTKMSLSFFHNSRKNNYFYRNLISVENTISTAFLLETGNRDYSINFEGEKYVHFLRTTIQLESNYLLSFYKNIVNNSDLRNVEAQTLTMGLSLRPAAMGNVSIENKINYSNSIYLLEDTRQNSFSSLKDMFKIVYKMSDVFRANVTLNYIATDLSVDNNYTFIDAELQLTSKNKKIEYSLIGRNLTNNLEFKTVSASDYYRMTSSHNLLERYILGSISFRF